jgi:hypothetical protein
MRWRILLGEAPMPRHCKAAAAANQGFKKIQMIFKQAPSGVVTRTCNGVNANVE